MDLVATRVIERLGERSRPRPRRRAPASRDGSSVVRPGTSRLSVRGWPTRARGRGRESNCVSRATVNTPQPTATRRSDFAEPRRPHPGDRGGRQPTARHADRSVRRGWLSRACRSGRWTSRSGEPMVSRMRRREPGSSAAGLVVAQQECLMRWPKMGAAETTREEAEVFDVATTLGAWIVSILSPGDDRFSESRADRGDGRRLRAGSRARVRDRARSRAVERQHRHPQSRPHHRGDRTSQRQARHRQLAHVPRSRAASSPRGHPGPARLGDPAERRSRRARARRSSPRRWEPACCRARGTATSRDSCPRSPRTPVTCRSAWKC